MTPAEREQARRRIAEVIRDHLVRHRKSLSIADAVLAALPELDALAGLRAELATVRRIANQLDRDAERINELVKAASGRFGNDPDIARLDALATTWRGIAAQFHRALAEGSTR